MLKIYKWRGSTWQIDDKDLHRYPGAVLVEKEKDAPAEKKKQPANKTRKEVKNK